MVVSIIPRCWWSRSLFKKHKPESMKLYSININLYFSLIPEHEVSHTVIKLHSEWTDVNLYHSLGW